MQLDEIVSGLDIGRDIDYSPEMCVIGGEVCVVGCGSGDGIINYSFLSIPSLHRLLHIGATSDGRIVSFYIDYVCSDNRVAMGCIRRFMEREYKKTMEYILERDDIYFDGVYMEYDYEGEVTINIFVSGDANTIKEVKKVLEKEKEENWEREDVIHTNFIVILGSKSDYSDEEINEMIKII
jgi:hypothetical protein